MCFHRWFEYEYGLSDYRICKKCGLLQEDVSITAKAYRAYTTWGNKGTVDDPKAFIKKIKDEKRRRREEHAASQEKRAKTILSWKTLEPVKNTSESRVGAPPGIVGLATNEVGGFPN